MKYKSLYYAQFGSPEVVINEKQRELPVLNDDEALIEMLMAPINPSDLIPVTGAYAHRIPLPSTVGYEGVGIVKAVGSPLYEHLVGKVVLPLKGEGTWQELVVSKSADLVPVPDFIDIHTACQAYINPVTAWRLCTEELTLHHNDFLLVNACNSSIGRIFIQLSNVLDFRIIAVIRDRKYEEELRRLGADFIIDASRTELFGEVMKITGGSGAQAAIDSIGGEEGTLLAKCVKKQGDFITIGLLSGKQVDWQLIHSRFNIFPRIFHLRHWADNCSASEWQSAFQQIFSLIGQDRLRLTEPKIFYPFESYNQAVIDSMNPTVKNKVYLSFK